MLTKTVDLQKESPDLKGLLLPAADGIEKIFTEGDDPVARLVPIGKRVAGLHQGAIQVSKDFEKPLPEGFWTGSARSCFKVIW